MYVAAQLFGAGSQPTVTPLADPPVLSHYLFESPLPVMGVSLVAALVLAWLVFAGRVGKNPWPRRAIPILLLIAAAVWMTAKLVQTEREALIERTNQFIKVTAAADTSSVGAMLAPEVAFRLLSGSVPYNRDQILDLVRKYPGEQAHIIWHKTDSEQAAIAGASANVAQTQVHVRVRSKEDTMYGPVGSWWRIDWKRDGDQWKATAIECLQIDGVPTGAAVRP